jgi:hypothetical protein
MADAFFLPQGDSTYLATEHTQGPWQQGLQHGGPPAALLGREIERTAILAPAETARVTCEILGPVPVGEVEVRARVARTGRSVELIEAELEAGGRTAVKAAAWRIRTTDVEVPAVVYGEPPPLPEPTPERFEHANWVTGYLDAIEWRFASGFFATPGPATAWTRMRHPLLPDEEPSPLQRALIVADSGNGLSSTLDPARFWFINPDLSLYLHRAPVGEWVCVEARTIVQPHGIGYAETVLYDAEGPIGRGNQSLLVGPR